MHKIVLGITLAFSLLACDAGQSSQAYVQSARDYLDVEEVAEAEIELKNALRTDGENTEARFLLGKVYFEKGELLAARKELMLALSAAQASEKVMPILAKVYLGLSEHEALMELQGSDLSAPSHATILAAKGLSELANGRLVNALEYTQRAAVVAPESTYARVALARVFASKVGGNSDRAREQLAAIFERDEGNVSAWELLGDIEVSEMNTDAAVRAYSQAIERGTNTVTEQFKRAVTLINDGQFEAAQQDVDALLETQPKGIGVNYAQGLLHFRGGRLKESLVNFDIALQSPKAWPQAHFYAGMANMLLGNLEQAETLAEQFYTSSGKSKGASLLLASIKIRKNGFSTAELLLEPIVDFSDDIEARNLMVVALAGQGRYEEAGLIAAEVVSLQPESAPAHARAGASYYLAGAYTKADGFLKSAIALDDSYLYPARLLSESYLDRNEAEQAVAVVAAYIKKNPESARALLLLARTELQLGKDEKALHAVRQALALQPNHMEGLRIRGDIALAHDNYPEAAEYFQKMLAIEPLNLEGLLSLAKIAGVKQDAKKMEMWLDKAISAHPYNIQPRLVLARHYLANGAAQKAILTLSGLPDSTATTVALLEARARAYLQLRDFGNAEYALQLAFKQHPKIAELHFLMAQVRVGQTDQMAAIAELKTALGLSPKHSGARILLAKMLITLQRIEEAGAELQILRDSIPEIQLHALEIDYALNRGDGEGSLRRAEVYFEEVPSTVSAITLARSQFFVAQKNRAVQHLLEWLKLHGGDVAARVALAELYAAVGEADDSLQQYVLALEFGGEDFTVLNNLAWYLRDTDPQKAIGYALRAQAVDSSSVELMDTLVVLYINTGDFVAAREMLTKAIALGPQNRSLLYRRAQLAHANGNLTEAQDMLSELLADANNFRLRTEAEALYASLSGQLDSN
ncbi:MAG: putative PEP-CTERM system TPR-repeat lipoprotein [Halioglobus sp.]|jgi:putative PEP-CTERM system TPR-repeat lipoprotein